MKRIYWLLSAIVVLLAIGLGLYAIDLSRQAGDRRQIAEQQRQAKRQQHYEEMKQKRSNLSTHLESNERAIEVFCHPEHKTAKPADAAFNKRECDILQETHRQLVRNITENDQEIKEWLAAARETPLDRH